MSSLLKKTGVRAIYWGIVFLSFALPTTALASEATKWDLPTVKLSDGELNQIRGGCGGVHFGIRLSGYVENVGPVEGALVSNGSECLLATPGGELAQLDRNGATVQAYVGNFDGASGIFQIVQSPGSNNIINNNLLLEITVINVMDGSAIPSLETYLH